MEEQCLSLQISDQQENVQLLEKQQGLLRSLFCRNVAFEDTGGGEPSGAVALAIIREFGSYERFKIDFTKSVVGIQGSGWVALAYCKTENRLLIMEIERYYANIYPLFVILMVVDVFANTCCDDCKNDRVELIEAFWNLVNWDEVNKRFDAII